MNLHNIAKLIKQDPVAKAELKAAGITKQQLIALIAGRENFYNDNKAATKVAMEQEAGITINNIFAKKLNKAWMADKIGGM